jgi:hypothetical protein
MASANNSGASLSSGIYIYELGLVFSVFFRLCALIIMIPAGVTHTIFNSQYFSFKDVKRILARKKKGRYRIHSCPI